MSGPTGRNGQTSAAPSDPLDAAIASLDESRQSLSASDRNRAAKAALLERDDEELEAEDDGETDEGTPSRTAPTDDDEDDDEDESDEDNTPDELDDEDDEDVPEVLEAPRKKQAKPESREKPGKKQATRGERDSEDDDGEPKLSRKQRGKLITELRQQLDAEQAERVRLQSQQQSVEQEDKQLEEEVRRALGSDDDFDKAMEAGLRGDETSAERARIWRANRNFFNKLVRKAKKDVRNDFTQTYWGTVQKLPGVDQKILGGNSLSEVLEHLYQAGQSSVQSKATSRLEELEEEVETWKGKYQSLKARAGGARRSPVTGGSQAPPPRKQKLSNLLGPDGLPTDEAENLVRRQGFGSIFGKNKTRA